MKNENRVTEFVKNPKKALFKLSMPIIIGMIVQTLYNIVDTAFVGRLGYEAIAALTFSFPLFFIMMAVNSGIAVGMSSKISRYLGSKDKIDAENTAIHGFILSIIAAVVLFVIGFFSLKPFFLILGAKADVMALALEYMNIILIGIFFMFPAYVIHSILSAEGDTKTPMIVNVTSLLSNVVMDFVFIYILGMGVAGAALATSLSFIISLVMFIIFLRKKSYIQLSHKYFRLDFKIIKEIFMIGIPAGITMLLMSIYLIFLNKFMVHFGTEYVAAFGISSRLESIVIMPLVGIAMSTMTLIGMFYGAKKYNLLKKTVWYSIKVGIVFTFFAGIFLYLFSPLVFKIFTSDSHLIKLAYDYMKINLFTFPFVAIAMIISRSMQGMGFGFPGLIINLVRVLLVSVPLAYLFIFILGYGYLWIAGAMIIGGLASSIIGIIWLEIYFKKTTGKF